MTTVLHITTVHPRADTRIFIKEAHTMAVSLSCTVILLIADGLGDVNASNSEVSIHDIGILQGGRIGRIMGGTWRTFLGVCRIRPAVVHFHDPELIPLALFLKLTGCKVVYDVHEDVPRQTISKEYLPLLIRKPLALAVSAAEWCGAKIFDAIIPATPKIAERFPSDKTVTVQNFPVTDELLSPSPVPYIERPEHFAYIGVIAKIRCAAEMVRACDLLTQSFPHAGLDLAGMFDPPELQDELKETPGWAYVKCHGQVSRSKVGQILGKVRAGLVLFYPLPNHTDAQPNKMFEYMSAGLPVIASDFPFWRRIIDSAGCGLLVDPLNPRAIAEAMCWILDHPAEAEDMGRRGRRAVELIYNWHSEAEKLLDLYKKLI